MTIDNFMSQALNRSIEIIFAELNADIFDTEQVDINHVCRELSDHFLRCFEGSLTAALLQPLCMPQRGGILYVEAGIIYP